MVVLLIWIAVGGARCAKRHSTGSQLVAGSMLLVLGISMAIVKHPQQGLEQSREDKGKKGAESGDPPQDSPSSVYDGP